MKYQSTKRIRTGLLTAALAGGTLLGASQLGGIANAQTDETPTTEAPTTETPEATTVPTENPTDDVETDDDRRPAGGTSGTSQEIADMPGSGLGLSIVAPTVEVHGSEVWAQEADGGGADVGFRLPLFSADATDATE